jgi:hypothetical protein
MERYHRLLRVAEAIDGDADLAHDAVQESFAGEPDVATTKALHNRTPELRFFYGGTRP